MPALDEPGRRPALLFEHAGEGDTSDIQAIARRLGRGIAGARGMTIAAAGHLPSMERPDDFNGLPPAFLDDLAVVV